MGYQLVGTHGGKNQTFVLVPGTNLLGRASAHADLVLHSEAVSRLHAQIDVDGDRIEIRDRDSHNGTFVNGVRVATRRLGVGDSLRFGDVELTLLREKPDDSEELETGKNASTNPLDVPSLDSWDSGRSQPRFKTDSQLDSAQLIWSPQDTGVHHGSDKSGFLAALVDLAQFLVRDEGEEDVCASCLQRVAGLFDFRLACLLEMNAAGETEVRCHTPRKLAPDLEISRSMVDAVVREGKALLVRDVADEAPLWMSAYRRGIRSAIIAPLMQNTEVLGVLYLDHEDPHHGFDKRHLRRLQLLADLVAAKLARVRSRKDIQLAGLIQRQLLGTKLRHPEGYEVAVRLEPSEMVGGDLYETLELPDGRYLYALGDIVGHGMAAALLMSNVLASLRALARHASSSLQLADELQRVLSEQLAPHGFVTMLLGFLDPQTHRFEYVNAGHEPAVLLVPGKPLQTLTSTGPPLGMPIGVPLSSAEVELPPGTALCAWSDGIPESFRVGTRPPQDFTRERILQRLEMLRDEPAGAIVSLLFDEVDAFVGNHPAQDDRTMLVLRRG